MAIPEGYQFLAKLGIVYKGDYDENVTYNQYDAVYYNGSTYIALVDSPAGPPTADGVNWQYMAQGFLSQVISSLTATDKNGVIGKAGATVNAQDLIDGMSDDIKGKLDKDGDASDTTEIFEQASERTNIISGESHKTIFGKIKKWFADMTAAAFMQVITSNTDLMATTVSGYLVDALAVKNQFDVVNSNLSYQTDTYTCSHSSNQIIAERSGNVVTLIMPNLLSTLPTKEEVVLATVDTKYAPPGERQFRIVDINNSNEIIMFIIKSSGVVSVYYYGTGNYTHSTANTTLTYLVAN